MNGHMPLKYVADVPTAMHILQREHEGMEERRLEGDLDFFMVSRISLIAAISVECRPVGVSTKQVS